MARRRARRQEWSSRAVWPVAGHGVRNGRRVPYRPSPDRVRLWPVARSRAVTSRPMSATSASLPWSRSGEPNARRRPCPGPTIALSPTPPPAIYEHIFFCMAVALYRGAFGGAAKRNRWAVPQPETSMPNRK